MTHYTPGPPHPADNFRSPSWRHDRAALLAAQGRRPSRRDDRWVRLACRHLLRQEGGRGGRPPAGADDVVSAYQIRSEEIVERWYLEALLLTGEAVEATAARCGLEPGVVEAYAALFHDVLHMLHARDYIAHRLLPRRAALGVRPDDVGGLLKLAAWRGGPLAAETVCGVLTGRGVPRERFGSLSQDELEDALNELNARFWLLLQTLPLEAFLPWRIGKLNVVREALAALTQVRYEAESEASRVPAGVLGGWVILEEGPRQKEAGSGLAGEMLERLHGAIDAIECEFGQRAA